MWLNNIITLSIVFLNTIPYRNVTYLATIEFLILWMQHWKILRLYAQNYIILYHSSNKYTFNQNIITSFPPSFSFCIPFWVPYLEPFPCSSILKMLATFSLTIVTQNTYKMCVCVCTKTTCWVHFCCSCIYSSRVDCLCIG